MSNESTNPTVQEKIEKLERHISSNERLAWILVWLGVIAAIFGVVVVCYNKEQSLSFLGKLSNLGSYFQGAVGSLWSLAALMFIYVAFLGQKQQLLLQSEEMEGQEKQFQSQQESIQRQNFESAFFQLLNLHAQNISQMRQLRTNSQTKEVYVQHEGRSCFVKWFNEMKNGYFLPRPTDEQHKDVKYVAERYLEFYENNQTNLAHYFRTLYHVFKFIDDSDVENKRRYTSLARAQLSAAELLLLFYNSLGPFGVEKFKPLVEKFGIYEHLNCSLLLHPSHKDFYDPKAFI